MTPQLGALLKSSIAFLDDVYSTGITDDNGRTFFSGNLLLFHSITMFLFTQQYCGGN
jgi:hypothetical protein